MTTTSNQSIVKAIRVLEIVCASPARLSIREIATRTGYSLATTHRVLKTLRQVGAVQSMQGGWFTLGPRLVELHAQIADELCRTKNTVMRNLEGLLDRPGLSARLSMFVGRHLFIVAGSDSGVHHRFRSRIGGRYAAYCTAPGKTLLAYLEGDELDLYLRQVALLPQTRNTIVEPTRFLRELRSIRLAGYAFDDQEAFDGVRCVSVLLESASKRESAALSVATEALAPRELLETILPRLTARAETLTGELCRLRRGLGALLPAFDNVEASGF